MKALPDRNADNFPEALKAARQAKNLTYSDLAKAIGIHVVMPSRYENRDHQDFTAPSQKTWEKLNSFLTSEDSMEYPLAEIPMEQLIEEIKRRAATAVQLTF